MRDLLILIATLALLMGWFPMTRLNTRTIVPKSRVFARLRAHFGSRTDRGNRSIRREWRGECCDDSPTTPPYI